jgi:predicted O-methyltransferase YrrM
MARYSGGDHRGGQVVRLPSLIEAVALGHLVDAARTAPPGDFLELGVYQGGSASALYEVAVEQGRRLWLFDTFTGMPEATGGLDLHQVGDFADTSAEAVQAALPLARIRVGVFPATLEDDVGPIALAHIDCDQYATTLTACYLLGPRMVPGGVMIFDDYDCLNGATAAVDAVFGSRVVRGIKARVLF